MVKPLYSLKKFNTLHLGHGCQQLLLIDDEEQLCVTCQQLYQQKIPMLLIGGGSNIVLTTDFAGTVVVVNTKGITSSEDSDYFYLSVAAGEVWHELVSYCLEKNMAGLENLALIPGSVGAAPIQNIGAYGAEFKDFCDWVEYFDFALGKAVRVTTNDCRFGYRDSIFKQQLKQHCVILSVGLKLPKRWRPNLSYAPLQQLASTHATPEQLFKTIVNLRQTKLPDPLLIGNVGSFFKNPVVSKAKLVQLQQSYPQIISYPVTSNQVKLAAGWLIEHAGLKSVTQGGAGVHQQQGLVLVNNGTATGADIIALARHIVTVINKLYGVLLEVEPSIIGKTAAKGLFDE